MTKLIVFYILVFISAISMVNAGSITLGATNNALVVQFNQDSIYRRYEMQKSQRYHLDTKLMMTNAIAFQLGADYQKITLPMNGNLLNVTGEEKAVSGYYAGIAAKDSLGLRYEANYRKKNLPFFRKISNTEVKMSIIDFSTIDAVLGIEMKTQLGLVEFLVTKSFYREVTFDDISLEGEGTKFELALIFENPLGVKLQFGINNAKLTGQFDTLYEERTIGVYKILKF